MKEVAFLFAGIFLTMLPVLQHITAGAKSFGSQLDVSVFFWSSGLLSSVLDNAPTYLNFLSAAMGKYGLDSGSPQQVAAFLGSGARYISAVSIACVFFGAMTYIGNGPNFMVRAMSERAGIRMPSFFGFIQRYSVPILLPVFAIIWALFLR
jgi:Na+/H+ antiporter NhaD/arsenite permease-like protein